jgi:hypothetical protein
MQRYRLDALQDQAGRLYLHGRPFTGIAYEVKSNQLTANYRVIEGILGGPSEVWGPDRPRVLFQALRLVSADQTNKRFPEEGAYLRGAPFHGVAYAFDPGTGALLQEQDFHPTQPGPLREWYPSGALRAELDRLREDGTYESETWHENGQSEGVESLKLGFGYTPEGRLITLRVSPDCSTNDLDRLAFRVHSVLDLAGPGVTDEVIGRLEDLPRLEDLALHGTTVSARGLERFHVCKNLKSLTARKNTGFGEADVRSLLAGIPGCEWDGRLG